jgi:hypothetical protein
LPAALLPDEVAPFGETRDLMSRRHTLFLEQGGAAVDEMRAIDSRLAEIRAGMEDDFPLTQAEVEIHREQLSEQIRRIHDVEKKAVLGLQQASI